MGRLEGKVAVITGAASGMGRVTAIRFAQEGAAVVVADLNSNGGEETVAECKKAGGRAVFQRVDVMNESDIKGAVDRAVKEFGRLDVMFNNAGLGGAIGKIEETTVENWDKTHAILLRAVFLGMKHAIPAMRKGGGGRGSPATRQASGRAPGTVRPCCASSCATARKARRSAPSSRRRRPVTGPPRASSSRASRPSRAAG